MLGTSDAWSMSRSSQQPSKPAYHIEDCRICGIRANFNISNLIDFKKHWNADKLHLPHHFNVISWCLGS